MNPFRSTIKDYYQLFDGSLKSKITNNPRFLSKCGVKSIDLDKKLIKKCEP